jgi:Tol biopolymer transport system component
VSANGGTQQAVVRSDPEHGNFRVNWPIFLPDGRSFFYVAWHAGHIDNLMLSRPGRPVVPVMPVLSRTEYVEPGYLVFARDGVLFSQRFDAESGKVSGPPVSVANSVSYFLSTGWADFSARRNTLAYRSARTIRRLAWFDRSGRPLGTIGEPGGYLDVAISPDGTRALYSRARPGIGTYDIWSFDFERGLETAVTSSIDSEFAGMWLPDGKAIVYSTVVGPAPQLFLRNLATGEDRRLAPTSGFQQATSVSPDGRVLAFNERPAGGPFEAWTLSLAEPGAMPKRFGMLPASSNDGRAAQYATPQLPAVLLRFSPDGRAIALLSAESGSTEAYVAPGGSAEKVRVSANGAAQPRFRRDGGELYFLSDDGRLMAVPLRTSPSFQPGKPAPLFAIDRSKAWFAYDVAPDGRFLAVEQIVSGGAQPTSVFLNWRPEVRK